MARILFHYVHTEFGAWHVGARNVPCHAFNNSGHHLALTGVNTCTDRVMLL